MKKKVETSKKIAWLSGICFVVVLIYSMVIFAYGIFSCKTYGEYPTYNYTVTDYTMLITLITVTGATFGTTTAFYYSKSKYENVNKIQRSFLKSKYLILKEINALDESRIQSELENELSKIEYDADNEKSLANQEITYNG